MYREPNYFILKEKVNKRLEALNVKLTKDLRERVDEELDAVDFFNDSENILLLEQMAEFSRANDVLFIIAGDWMTSYVCYLLGISPLNPIEYKLEFMQCEYWQQKIGLEKGYFRVITDPRGRELLTEAFSKHKHPIIFEVPEICTGNSLVEGMVPLGNISTLPCGTVFKLLARDKNLNDAKVYDTFNSGNLSGIFDIDTKDIAKFFVSAEISNFTDLVFAITSCVKNGLVPPDKYGNSYELNVKYKHPYLNEYLKDTRGHVLFRDQWLHLYSYFMGIAPIKAILVLRAYEARVNIAIKIAEREGNPESIQDYNFEDARRFKRKVKKDILEELSVLNAPIMSEEVASILANRMGGAYNLKGNFYAEALLTYLTAYNKTYYPEEYKKLYDGVLEIR